MSKLISELKRRNVFRVAALYLVSAWLIAQIADVVIGLGNLPPTIGRTILIILAMGFPVAVVLAWVFEWTPEGIRLEAEPGEEAAVPHSPGRRLDYVIMSLLSVALVYFIATHDWGSVPEFSGASIAVLPFENRSAQAEDLYFTDGVHDDLLTQLAKISSLIVISRTSVMRYRDSGKTIPEIAAELGVATILEGGVQRSGNRVRINLQLIDAATDQHIWAETYDKELSADNVFEIQREIATSIAALLRAKLLPVEQQRMATVPTHNLDAYDAYLIGRRYLATRSREGLSKAKEHFSRAIELDPDFAHAYTGLSDALALISGSELADATELFAEAERAALRALELNPQLAEAHTSLGAVMMIRGDTPAEYASHLERAVELAPGSADAHKWYSNYLAESGRPEEALQLLQKAVVLDPMSAIVRVNLGQALETLGQFDEAQSAYRKALEIEPGFGPAVFGVTEYGDRDENLVIFSDVYSRNYQDPWTTLLFVLTYLELGDDSRAAQWVAMLERLAPESTPALVAQLNLSLYRGMHADTLRVAAELLAIEVPMMPVASRILLTHDLRSGNPQAALARYEQKYPALLANSPQVADDYPAAIDIAMLLKALDDGSGADQLLERSLAYLDTLPRKGNRLFEEARIFALKGDQEEALRRLGEAINARWSRHWWFSFTQDPAFDFLKEDLRFQAMADELAARMARQLANVRKLEASGEIVLPQEKAAVEEATY